MLILYPDRPRKYFPHVLYLLIVVLDQILIEHVHLVLDAFDDPLDLKLSIVQLFNEEFGLCDFFDVFIFAIDVDLLQDVFHFVNDLLLALLHLLLDLLDQHVVEFIDFALELVSELAHFNHNWSQKQSVLIEQLIDLSHTLLLDSQDLLVVSYCQV